MGQTRGWEGAAAMFSWKMVAVVLAALGFFAPVHGHFGKDLCGGMVRCFFWTRIDKDS